MRVAIFLLFTLLFSCSVKQLSGQTTAIPVTTNSNEALVFYRIAFAAEDAGDFNKAIENYGKAIEADTSFALAYLGLALLQDQYAERTKYMAKAMQFADKVSEGERLWLYGRNSFYGNGKREEEFVFFERLAALHPEDPIAQYLFGYMNHHHGRKNFQRAIHHLEKAVAINPAYCIALNDLANAYIEIKDFSNAERVLVKQIFLQPQNVKALDTYAEMLTRSGQYEKSIEFYKEALKINASYPWSILGQAANLNFLGKHKEARNILPQLHQFKLTERETYHIMLAFQCSYIDEGKTEAAINVLKRYDSIGRKNNLLTQQYLANNNITRIYFEYGDAEKGLQSYRNLNQIIQQGTYNAATKKNVADVSVYYTAFASWLAGNSILALQQLDEYVKLKGSPDDMSKILRAKILLKEKNPSEALKFLQECDTDNPYAQYWMGMCYEASSQKNEAIKLYTSIAERNEMQDLDYHLVRKLAISKLKGIK